MYVQDKMIVLVEKMRQEKNIVQPVCKLIRYLKLEYDSIGLFENNGAADVEEIVQSILEGKCIVWHKFLEGNLILDPEDYNIIIETTVCLHLFQEGQLHKKIDKNVLAPETEETKAEVMVICTSLFENVAKAHAANKAVAQNLKELLMLIKDPGSLF